MLERRSGYITVGNEQLHYLQTGTGSRLLLAFHGYGDNAALFNPICNYLHNDFTVISIDLPHHGRSNCSDEYLFTEQDLSLLANELLAMLGVDTLTLMGYSIGGRICLKLLELIPGKIDKVILLASDGLVFNRFYYLMTRNPIGKKIFKSFLTQPEKYMPVINFGKATGVVSRERYLFAMKYINAVHDRAFLLKVWPSLSLLLPDTERLRDCIERYKISVHIFMGSADFVIPVKHARTFKKQIDSAELHILDKGHRILDADTLPLIAECLLS